MWAETVTVVAKTAKAILVSYEDVEGWVPLSIIGDDSEIYGVSEVGEVGVLCIPERFAESKGWVI